MSNARGFISTLIQDRPDYELEIYKLLLQQNPVATRGVTRALSNAPISDEAAALIIQTKHSSLLTLLAKNPNITEETKVQLALLGYKSEKVISATETVPIDVDTSSLIFPFSTSDRSNPESIGGVSGTEVVLPDVANYLYLIGHPYSILDPRSEVGNPTITEEALRWMIKREYLHRIFWRELTELDDEFDVWYRYQGRVSVLFVSHSILEQDFDGLDLDEDPILGGALLDRPERPWTAVTESLFLEYAADEVVGRSDSAGSIVDLAEESDLLDTYFKVLALLTNGNYGDRDSEKYGVSLTTKGQESLIEKAENTIEYDMHDIEVGINFEFEENLSWKNLQTAKQFQLFSLLKLGLISTNEELSVAAEHFLGCMALHPNTPQEILEELVKLENELIQEVLESRN